ncbi:hypothetical protein CRM22_002423 [Opisthorchis felineus]|uniref:Scaffold attachment factor B2 n=1 Tax=Opisthorchis felineus TaxID=147828 RepID=A0A4S2MAJ6_OPIFE|nr:hypothetical protein CRM22_002423 [Opisthorchis felineus]
MDGRLLADLKVADLRRELERRLKDKSGVKQVLVDRLREALEEEGLDPQNYRFGIDADLSKADSEVLEQMSVNEDDGDFDKSPIGKGLGSQNHADIAAEEQPEQKKLNEESVPFVVQVGDQEEDLDYDLKADSNGVAQSNLAQTEKAEECKPKTEEESGKGTEPGSEIRNLWISNLPRTVKAADLKQHFSKAGKVVSATVVMSTRTPGGCFGFVEMASVEDAVAAAKKFDGSDFNGSKLTVEATGRKAPTLASKAASRTDTGRAKTSPPKAKAKRPAANRFVRARKFASAMRRRGMRMERSTRIPYDSSRLAAPPPRPVRPSRPVPNLLAYQSLRRARILAASRYGLARGLQQVMERPIFRSRIPRPSPAMPRSVMRYSNEPWTSSARYLAPERRELRLPSRPEPIRRPDPRPLSGVERRRVGEPFRVESRSRLTPPPRPVPRRSEPLMRRASPPPRPRMPPPMSPLEHRRPLQSAPRSLEHAPRYEKSNRPPLDSGRTYSRPSDPIRVRPEPRSLDRTDFSRPARGLSNGRYPTPPNGSFSQSNSRYKPQYATRIPQSGPRTPPSHPGSRDSQSRRDYRGMSRSPPRSRDAALVRPYPGVSPQHRMGRLSPRDRSPMHAGGSGGPRPKVVDYGHRSEPRPDWSPWRGNGPSIQTPSGHTWKPAGQSMVSNYGSRGSGRRYP